MLDFLKPIKYEHHYDEHLIAINEIENRLIKKIRYPLNIWNARHHD